MSDYTPTTEEVRTDYVLAYTDAELFDRWIAQHDREVRAEALNGARAELQAAYKRGPGARLDGLESTWRKGVAKAHRIVRDYQDRLWTGGAS